MPKVPVCPRNVLSSLLPTSSSLNKYNLQVIHIPNDANVSANKLAKEGNLHEIKT